MAIDANAAVAADGAVLLGRGEGVLAAGPLGRFGGELGGHAHHLGPGALPKAERWAVGVDQAGAIALIEATAVVGEHHDGGCEQFLGEEGSGRISASRATGACGASRGDQRPAKGLLVGAQDAGGCGDRLGGQPGRRCLGDGCLSCHQHWPPPWPWPSPGWP